jgi:hypothetical protein
MFRPAVYASRLQDHSDGRWNGGGAARQLLAVGGRSAEVMGSAVRQRAGDQELPRLVIIDLGATVVACHATA